MLVKDKAVIVTGGGGSIGSEICERIATFGAARLLVSRIPSLPAYAVTERGGAPDVRCCRGTDSNIRDRERISG